jgi:hypothetical protein
MSDLHSISISVYLSFVQKETKQKIRSYVFALVVLD